MKFKTIALALAVAGSGIFAGQAFAQDRDVTVTHERADGAVVTKHVRRSEDGMAVHRTVRVDRPDGSTVVRHVVRRGDREDGMRLRRTVVIHHRELPMRHVVVRTVHHRPAYVINRHVTVIHRAG